MFVETRNLMARAFDGFETSCIRFLGGRPGMHNCPTPGTENLNKCPGLLGEGGEGGHWQN